MHGKPHDDDAPLELLFLVDDIDSLFVELSARGARIIQPLREMPYAKEFYIADPDGNVMAFMEIPG